MDFRATTFYNSYWREQRSQVTASNKPPGRRNPAALSERKDSELSETIHLHHLSPSERLLEESAERGFVEEKDIQALSDEHELTEDDLTGSPRRARGARRDRSRRVS